MYGVLGWKKERRHGGSRLEWPFLVWDLNLESICKLMKISGAEFRSKSGSHGFRNESNNHFPIRHRLCVQLSRGSCRNYVGFVYGLYLKYSDSELWSPINCRQPVQSWPTSHEDVRGRRVNLSQIYSTHKWMKTRPASRSLSQPARWWISTTFKFHS